jgi:two-component system chemotaxis sensor kinase CheA
MEESAEEVAAEDDENTTLLVFRGGSESHKAVPLSLVTRLEEIDASKIEWVGGRPLIQYRGHLMPLVPADADITIKREGTQALVVFSDGDRSMGLVVDAIIDIVDDTLNIELVNDRSDLIGSAVIRGRATEVVNVGHYLPLAYEDWGRAGPPKAANGTRNVLLVDDSAFFRDMLTPVLKAAGYKVISAASAEQALDILASGPRIDVLITDVEMPEQDGFHLVETIRGHKGFAELPVIALSSGVSPEAIDQARKLKISEFVAKFDRSGLVSALAETQSILGEAA